MRSGRSTLTQVRRFPLFLAVAAMLATASTLTVSARQATPDADSALEAATTWIIAQQADDGGFLGFSGESDASTTADAVIALAAAKNAGVDVELESVLVYLRENALVFAQTGPGQAAKLVLAIVAAGGDPTDVDGVNPLSLVEAGSKSESGMIGFGPFDHALGILALVVTGTEVPDTAIEVLRTTQTEDGSWGFDGGTAAGTGDTNTTSMVIQALVAAGLSDDSMVARGLDYLKSTQVETGAFPYQPGSAPNGDANSTAFVVQAIIAVGQDPASTDWNNAAAALATFQNPSGAFQYTDDQPDDNLFATLQAIPAIAGQAYPIAGVADVDAATPIAA
jgi:prenyltransferase beta subunit